MKYAITGGAGFIGSHIAEKLAPDHEIIIIDSLFSGNRNNINGIPVTFEKGTVTDINFLNQVFQDIDGVFHLAAITSVPRSVKQPLPTHEVNCNGTLNVLMAAKECGVKKVVYASSSSVYGDTDILPKTESMIPSPLSPYGVSKLTGEYYCSVFSRLYGLHTIALRYFNVFGPRQDPKSEYSAVIPRFITRILNNESPVIYGNGTQTRDFTYVKDVVQANIEAMKSNAQGVFNVACQQQTTLQDLAEMIMEIIGTTLPIRYEPERPGDIHDSLADISKAGNAFGYLPSYSVRDGLKETVSWYRLQ